MLLVIVHLNTLVVQFSSLSHSTIAIEAYTQTCNFFPTSFFQLNQIVFGLVSVLKLIQFVFWFSFEITKLATIVLTLAYLWSICRLVCHSVG